jgi:hypothetical protein
MNFVPLNADYLLIKTPWAATLPHLISSGRWHVTVKCEQGGSPVSVASHNEW